MKCDAIAPQFTCACLEHTEHAVSPIMIAYLGNRSKLFVTRRLSTKLTERRKETFAAAARRRFKNGQSCAEALSNRTHRRLRSQVTGAQLHTLYAVFNEIYANN